MVAVLAACTSVTVVSGGGASRDSVDPAEAGDTEEAVPGDTAADTGEYVTPGPPWEHLPVLLVEADGWIGDGSKTPGTMEVIVDHDGTLEDLDEARRDWTGAIGIEIHGSSSTGYPKLGYRVECRDEDGTDGNCALAGLPEGSDWVLRSNYADKSFMREALAYGFGRAAAADRGAWEPRTQHVELYLDGDYEGIYLLVERVSVEEDRLPLPPATDPTDGSVDGGFIVKVDQHRSLGFDTHRATPIDWVDPHTEEVTEAEAAYLRDWFDQMETTLAADDFADRYADWIDVDGWIDHWLLNELTHNIDAYRLSAYLWTDGPPGASVMHAGPLWDFDRAFGNCNYCTAWTTYGWIYDDLDMCGYAYQYPFWWERLREDPAFRARLRARWDELRASTLSDAALVEAIQGYQGVLAEAQPRDQDRWHTIGTFVDPNYYVGDTWEDELEWLTGWLLERAQWMDAEVGEP